MSSPAQRDLIHSLMRELDWDKDRVTLMHTRAPHCGRSLVGCEVHVWLGCMTKEQASELIRWLQKEIA